MGRLFLRAIPLGGLVYNSVKEEKEIKNERRYIQKISETDDDRLKLILDIDKQEFYVLIEGDYEAKSLMEDIYTHFYLDNPNSSVELKHHYSERFHIFRIVNLDSERNYLNLLPFLAEGYGSSRIIGFCQEQDTKFYLRVDFENSNRIIGKTSNNRHLYYSFETFNQLDNFLIYRHTNNSDLFESTGYFEGLVNGKQHFS